MKTQRAILSSILRDKRFTGFEKAVYKTICRIKPGEVRSYSWVARAMGRPGAARAVGNALHKNPFPGTIPCHRVIRANGNLGGFAKGARLKRKMLKAEGIDCRDASCYNLS